MDIITLGLAKKYTNKKVKEAVFDGAKVELDDTLTKTGSAAEAQAVGNKIKEIEAKLPNFDKASVGQFVAVKTIDEGGKPTEWEAVDMPKQANADWNQNDPNVPGYVENRTHWATLERKFVQRFFGTSGTSNKYSESHTFFTAPLGIMYYVNYAGKEYVCKSFATSDFDFCLGNPARYNSAMDDTGEPFFICKTGAGTVTYYTKDRYGITIEIYVDLEIIHKLDEKFIPDTIARVSDTPAKPTRELFLDLTVAAPNGTSGTYDLSTEELTKINMLFDNNFDFYIEFLYTAYDMTYTSVMLRTDVTFADGLFGCCKMDGMFDQPNKISFSGNSVRMKSAYGTLIGCKIYKIV